MTRPADKTLRLDAEFVDDTEVEYRGVYNRVVADLVDTGIVAAGQPLNAHGEALRPQLPPELGELTGPETLSLLGQYGAWLEYLYTEAAKSRVIHAGLDRRRNHVKAQLRMKSKGTQGDKTDRAITNDVFREVDVKEYEAKVRRELLEAIVEGGEKAFFVVSRIITSHGHEFDRTNRESHVAPKRSGGYGIPKTQKKNRR